MSWDATEDILMSAPTEGGRTVKDPHILTGREAGRLRGFAFAEFSNEAEAQAAICDLDGTNLDGREPKVDEDQERMRGGGRWKTGP